MNSVYLNDRNGEIDRRSRRESSVPEHYVENPNFQPQWISQIDARQRRWVQIFFSRRRLEEVRYVQNPYFRRQSNAEIDGRPRESNLSYIQDSDFLGIQWGGEIDGLGLSDEEISANLKIKSYLQVEDDKEVKTCAVCLDDIYGKDQKIAVLDCGHEYHLCCIKKWLQKKNRWPMELWCLPGVPYSCNELLFAALAPLSSQLQ